MGKKQKQWQIFFSWAPESLQVVTANMKLKTPALWKTGYDKPRQHIKKQRHYFPIKGPSSQRYGFSGSHVWMWEVDQKEVWAPKNWCFQMVLLKKNILKVPWTARRSNLCFDPFPFPFPKGNQSWIFTGRTDPKAAAPILWTPDTKNWLIRK